MKIKVETPEFFSNGDEKRFFEGLECISVVERIQGCGC